MRQFKFFSDNRVFSEWLDALDDYHLGGIQMQLPFDGTSVQPIQKPESISMRHWNMMPDDIKRAGITHMEAYIQGFEAAHTGVIENPFVDTIYRETWNLGFLFCRNRYRNFIAETR